MIFDIDGIRHERDDRGFIHQIESQPVRYTREYCNAQSTTVEMAYLRIGIIEREMGYDAMTTARVLELGPGAGVMMSVLRKHCRSVDGYDIAPTPCVTVSDEEAKKRRWDLLVACDVIEHFPRIDDLWQYDFEWGYISVPCLPEMDATQLSSWRHFKPNEHLWYFSLSDMSRWIESHGYEVKYAGHAEDLIRSRWDRTKPNISNFVIRRRD